MAASSTPAGHSEEAHEAKTASSIVQLDQAKTAMYVAGQKIEIKVGNHYVFKTGSGPQCLSDRVWKCFEIGKAHLGLMYQDMLSGQVSRIQVKDIEIAESLKATNKNHRLCWMPSMYLHCCVTLLQRKRMTSVPSSRL